MQDRHMIASVNVTDIFNPFVFSAYYSTDEYA